MRSGVRLDSVVFQLTPTRTRCDLVIIANGKTEKIVSGLLNPFLAHLKVAQDQIAKGGYSITLEPAPNKDAEWFTKGTIERFVRFVSTPEVLERVNTIESEILQIDEAIAVQGNDSIGLGTVEDHQTKPAESIEGGRFNYGADAEKAIVLYKPGSHAPDSNGSTAQEEKSKVHLMRALETRKTVLQKEQGMAFARAVAAGFDMDHMSDLISFADCFGASRMLEACIRFMDLWKAKHESGQWVDIEATEARPEFSSLHASGIIFPGDIGKHKELGVVRHVSNVDLGTESNGKDGASSADINSGQNRDPQLPPGPHDYYYQGQFQQPMFPQWPMPSASGASVFQPYPVQGMPYYQNYPAGTPLFQTPYPLMEDPRFTKSQKRGLRRHSMDSKYSNTDSEAWDAGGSGGRSKDVAERNMSEDEEDVYHGRESHKKLGHSRKKMSGTRNSDSFTSKGCGSSGSESKSPSDSETEEDEDQKRKHKDSLKSIKRKNSMTKSVDIPDINGKDEVGCGQEADAGNWQVFQTFLMKCEEENTRTVDRGMFSGEKEPPVNKRETRVNGDPVVSAERGGGGGGGIEDLRMVEFDTVNGRAIRRKQVSSKDELFSSDKRTFKDGHLDSQFKEIEGGGRGYRRTDSDEFMVYGRQKQLSNKIFSDPLENEHGHVVRLEKHSSSNTKDESFIVPSRLDTQVEFLASGRTALDMDAELPSALQRSEKSFSDIKNKRNYEPHDLNLMPKRNERVSVGYDPAADYDVDINAQDAVKLKARNQEYGPLSTKKETKNSGKEKKTRSGQDGNEKRKADLMVRKARPTKPNPLADARARAEKLRLFKLDLQKAKKEKEDEALKRLEALKQERQKRIAARSGSSSSKPKLTPQQTRAQLPAKASPISSYKGSKFSDSEPTSSSPITKVARKTTSLGSAGFLKSTKVDRLNRGTHSAEKELRRSASSLPDLTKESKILSPEEKEKGASIRTKRLSDPKGISASRALSRKSASIDKLPKQIVSGEPQKKKFSAIVHQNKTRSAGLPEPNMRALTGPSDTIQNKASKGTGSKNSVSSESHRTKRTNEKSSRIGNGDESVVVDKTIVMLENETIPASAIMPSEDVVSMRDGSVGEDRKGKAELVPDYVAIHVPPSSLLKGEAEDTNKHEVYVDYAKDKAQKLLNPNVTEKTYQAPYARATSLEHPVTNNLEYKETLSEVNHEASLMGSGSIKAHVADWPASTSAEQIHDALEKPRSRESSKGFRKLFKFGKKNQSSASGDYNLESDGASLVDSTGPAASTEVHSLKNLISQDEPQNGGSPHKVSRPFSILSPFRPKAHEKKVVA